MLSRCGESAPVIFLEGGKQMAIKTIEYEVNITGITPATEQFGGTQGDHRVTQLNYELKGELFDSMLSAAGSGRVMYRFDIYDGEDVLWSSDATELNDPNLSIELEERHTRFGGKITVYLVITVLTEDNETDMELYSFPSVLRLKNRPDGTYQDGEDHDSVAGLVEIAKANAEDAASYSASAQAAELSARQLAAEVEQKLTNGEFDGKDGVSVTHSFDGTVLKMTSASGTTSVDLKGEKGDSGPKGEKGDKGDTPDISGLVPKKWLDDVGAPFDSILAVNNCDYVGVDEYGNYSTMPNDSSYHYRRVDDFYMGKDIDAMPNYRGAIPVRDKNGNLVTGKPVDDADCANKKYVDDLVGNIENATADFQLVLDTTLEEQARQIDLSNVFYENWKEVYILVDAVAVAETPSTVLIYPFNYSAFCDFYMGAGKGGAIYIKVVKVDDNYLYYETAYNNILYKSNSNKSAIVKRTSNEFVLERSNFEIGTTIKVWVR